MKLLNMRNVRVDKGITQSQLAERIGCRQPYMSAKEKGMPASDEMAKSIADGLGVEVAETPCS